MFADRIHESSRLIVNFILTFPHSRQYSQSLGDTNYLHSQIWFSGMGRSGGNGEKCGEMRKKDEQGLMEDIIERGCMYLEIVFMRNGKRMT